MKNKFQKLGVVGVVSAFMLLAVSSVFAQRSWDMESNDVEDEKWSKSIENWDNVISEWDEKRDELHKKYYDDYDGYAEGCYEGQCWEESMFDLIILDGDYNAEFTKGRCDTKGELYNKDFWECSNGGQVMEFRSINGEEWESGNFGQGLAYKDYKGNNWESSNRGQVIKFVGANGEKWESSNFGQSVEYIGDDGQKWEGSDGDDADDMKWRND